MARSMIEANGRLFATLCTFCADREDPVQDSTQPRWLTSTPTARGFLKYLDVVERLSFGRHRHLALLEIKGTQYVGLIGFDETPDFSDLVAKSDLGGFEVCLLSELPVLPSATPAEVRNAVEAGSKLDPSYVGHHPDLIKSLYPRIDVLRPSSALGHAEIWSTFLRLCACDSGVGGSWIDDELAGALIALAELEVPSLPYQGLCRSIFDFDPGSLFLSLYRCIEATYAYEHATKLSKSLGLNLPWDEMAEKLEMEMGWRPPEAASLNVALAHASDSDLKDICKCLLVEEGNDLKVAAGRAIYKLRNSLVHYRPALRTSVPATIDWNRLCSRLVTVAMDTFDRTNS